jgi:hypothetical protein
MTSSTAMALLCAICGKGSGNFTCRGCHQDFCANHVIEHRQTLGKKMDEITLEHDQLRQNITDYRKDPCLHPLMKQIDAWQNKSINTILEIADEYRNKVRDEIRKLSEKTTNILEPVSQELNKSRENDTYVEGDLERWITNLKKLKIELITPPRIKIKRDSYDTIFINRLLVIETPNDVFQESIGNIKIEDNGKVITHGFWNSYGAVRGRGEYSSGCYQFRFKLNDFDEEKSYSFFFGIISKATPMRKDTFLTDTTCGWTGYDDDSFINYHEPLLIGVEHGQYKNQPNYERNMKKLKKDDIFQLLINCDRRKIRLTNERTNEVDEITIDVIKCPFPWQLNFALYNWNQRICLLTSIKNYHMYN